MKKITFIALSIPLVLLFSCSKEETEPVNVAVYNAMKDWYLWYEQIPTVDPQLYKSPTELLEAIKYKKLDRWSFIITSDEYQQYFVAGKYYGHGFGYGFDNKEQVRVIYVFKNSDLYPAGVRRGWIVKKINNTAVTPQNISSLLGENRAGIVNNFTFGRPENTDTTISSTKKEVPMDMVLLDTVYNTSVGKVGYLVLFSFIADAASELEQAFNRFVSAGINELIIDLRYNTGGFVNIGQLLASYIAGKNYPNAVWCSFIHNDKKTAKDTSLRLETKNNSLQLSRLFVITTRSTASTSEIIINGLRPYISVYTIGEKTEGKPVGMDVLTWKQHAYYLFPVSFKIVNKNGEGDYYNGLPVDAEVDDDMSHNFGNTNEECLKAALNYIEQGSFLLPSRMFKRFSRPEPKNWWDREFGAY
ncbi:MAG: S41 family peptidase [Bacteroidales bacterium]|nr:S41 family peptidase [Bacteroidales bacterium]